MSGRLASWAKAWRDSGGATPSRMAIAGGVLAVTAVGLAFVIGNPNPERAEAAVIIRASEVAELQTIDKGKQAELLVEGASAEQRNAQIPVSNLPLGVAKQFTAIASNSGQYDSALTCMTQAIYYEAANEPLRGKRAVAQVVLNRLKHPAYPNSVCGVVYEGVYQPVCQFSFTCDGALARKPLARQWAESKAVAKEMLAGKVEPSVGTATHYHADYVVPRWAYTLAKVEKVGTHIFYRFPGNAGSSGAFTRRWAGRESLPVIDWDRMRMLSADYEPEPEFTPGLTVTPHVTDRHAPADVGGRIDTTKTWRPSIPDPVASGGSYGAARAQQGDEPVGAVDDVAVIAGAVS
jgi:spore germination cell wall hydrolase CwlJ-like protein